MSNEQLDKISDARIARAVRKLCDQKNNGGKPLPTNAAILFGDLLRTIEHQTYVTVTHGGSGYFAVMVHWNETRDGGGFWEPLQTGRYRTHAEAADEGKRWAWAEGVEFRA